MASRSAADGVIRLLEGKVDDGVNDAPYDVLLAHWPWMHPDPKRLEGLTAAEAHKRAIQDTGKWLELRKRALEGAWRVTMQALTEDQLRDITLALGEVAAEARGIRIEGRVIDRQRDALVASKSVKAVELRRARKAYREALSRLRPTPTPDGDGWRFQRGDRQAMFELGQLMAEHPELILDFPQPYGPTMPGLPGGTLIRRNTRTYRRDGTAIDQRKDPMAHLMSRTIERLESAGIRGRKFSDVRALLLFAVGLTYSFDPKATLRLKNQDARKTPKGVRVARSVVAMSSDGRPVTVRTPEEGAEAFLSAFERREKAE